MEGVNGTQGSEDTLSAGWISETHDESSSNAVVAQGHTIINERNAQPVIPHSCQAEPDDPSRNGCSVEQSVSVDANQDIVEPRNEGNDGNGISRDHSYDGKSPTPSWSSSNLTSQGSLATKADANELSYVREASESRKRCRRASHTTSNIFQCLCRFLVLAPIPSSSRRS